MINTELLRTLLFRKKWSQVTLAKESGLSRATISAVCNGRSCSLETAKAIADALGVTLDSILLSNRRKSI